ncbi:MAG: 1-deoxy-D-xylulose-5-phosphate reductoisomerase [Boseongicola sp.]|nr:MAG: 1-deoxy-D-xylulose-5-phosphate reductoisomerase [Boseongicola sp.]
MRKVTIFGSTGSVGSNTIDLIESDPDAYEVVGLSGGTNIQLLAKQATSTRAGIAVTAHEELYRDLHHALAGTGIEVAAGASGLAELAERSVHWTMSSIVGAAGLIPGLKALEQGTTLALANKESLVTAGTLMMSTARKHGATILPVDSEHSAVFQALQGEELEAVERVILTASGGAFRDWPLSDLANATVEQASSHPNWSMGRRITIDSASMFNKALELIEAKEFFGFSPEKIETLVHPESLVHALVGYRDGALMAHLGTPDMRHAIGYALNWPARETLPVERLDLSQIGQLTFKAPDMERYPALRLARWVMDEGGLAGAAFNAAKETALDGFIDGKIRFTDMASVVEDVIEIMSGECLGLAPITLDTVQDTDQMARIRALESMARRQG